MTQKRIFSRSATVFALIVSSLISASLAHAQMGMWEYQPVSSKLPWMSSIAMKDSATGIAVGVPSKAARRSGVFRKEPGTLEWREVPFDAFTPPINVLYNESLADMWFAAFWQKHLKRCYVYGQNGNLYCSTNDGVTWFLSADGMNGDHQFKFGPQGGEIIIRDDSLGFTVSPVYAGQAWYTTDAGKMWRAASTTLVLNFSKAATSCCCWFATEPGCGKILKFISPDVWRECTLPPGFVDGHRATTGIQFIDELEGYACSYYEQWNGDHRILRTLDGGNTWSPLPVKITDSPYSIYLSEQRFGWIGGVFELGCLFQYGDDQWKCLEYPIEKLGEVHDLDFPSDDIGYAVTGVQNDGTFGSILRWENRPDIIDLYLSVPDMHANAGDTILVPIQSNTTLWGDTICAWEVKLIFDKKVLYPLRVVKTGTMSENMDVSMRYVYDNNGITITGSNGCLGPSPADLIAIEFVVLCSEEDEMWFMPGTSATLQSTRTLRITKKPGLLTISTPCTEGAVSPVQRPQNSRLYIPAPNPFSESTVISFEVTRPQHVKIRVYDALGRFVQSLFDDDMLKGLATVVFHRGNLPSGTYYIEMRTPEKTEMVKIAILR